jgi:pyruvate ferredoxin oxidoreductase gamma subunit
MLRVRFHGRGGHGIKTASRILGTAAFLSGLEVQDFPVYGAERRGAPIAAFTRIDHEPIRERGVILHPDLVLVADETLLDDGGAGVLLGREGLSALFVNCPRKPATVAEQYDLPCRVLTLDVTGLALERLGRGTSMSAALGAAGAALVNSAIPVPRTRVEQAIREELTSLGLGAEVIEKNVKLAQQVYDFLGPVDIQQGLARETPCRMHVPVPVETAEGIPIIFNTGNALQRHTGSWRIFSPAIDRAACTRCGICLVRCPDGAISLDAQGYPVIDQANCKGCLICCEECPIGCILGEREVQAW